MGLAALTLWRRELVRFYRQPNRIVGAIGSPLLFWLLLGSGLRGSFRTAEGQGYMEYFFPGVVLLTVLFTSIFSTISIIEDRREGFLQAVLVAPIGRAQIVLGKVLGGASVALLQGLILLALSPALGIAPAPAAAALAVLSLALSSFALTCLGFAIAWRMDSTQGFHAVMNLFLIPMWLLSGAAFPLSGVPSWLEWVMRANPMTYAVSALRLLLYGSETGPALLPMAVTAGFAAALFAAAVWVARRR
jgi:ABC-2 type transport system permease protein